MNESNWVEYKIQLWLWCIEYETVPQKHKDLIYKVFRHTEPYGL